MPSSTRSPSPIAYGSGSQDIPQGLHDASPAGGCFNRQAFRLGDAAAVAVDSLELRKHIAETNARPSVFHSP
eukprot:2779324-Pleurochrysis_carterae.AAC.1